MSNRCDAEIVQQVLTNAQIEEFLQNGVLVVPDILSPPELSDAILGLTRTLAQNGVDVNDLEGTGHALARLSSTNGSGGVLDLFYDDWKMAVASHPRLFCATTQLWDAAYFHQGEKKEDVTGKQMFKWHPYGAFHSKRGFMYVDRVGFRLPTDLAIKLGNDLRKGKKGKPIQRSLTPHLDCCPASLYSENKAKWRPIQCFVSLTSNLGPNSGGFEAASGFHRDFELWASNRPPSITQKNADGVVKEIAITAPCLGEYTHIRPKEDANVMSRIKHIPVPAGSAVFWDNRIPHANAYCNDTPHARAVVYCSFLPDVAINRSYVDDQRSKFFKRQNPSDQWINSACDEVINKDSIMDDIELSALGRKLLRIDDW